MLYAFDVHQHWRLMAGYVMFPKALGGGLDITSTDESTWILGDDGFYPVWFLARNGHYLQKHCRSYQESDSSTHNVYLLLLWVYVAAFIVDLPIKVLAD